MSQHYFDKAIALIDAANREDPNTEFDNGKNWPKELLYAQRMSEMLERFAPKADEAVKLAVRAQHIQRWESPRSDYPMNRKGYHQWRAALCRFHADTAAKLLEKAGYDQTFATRVKQIVGKQSPNTNPDSQLLEDVAGLVFLDHYLTDFVADHPEYDETKWNDIIRRVWNKLSDKAHQFIQAGHVKLPDSKRHLIKKVL